MPGDTAQVRQCLERRRLRAHVDLERHLLAVVRAFDVDVVLGGEGAADVLVTELDVDTRPRGLEGAERLVQLREVDDSSLVCSEQIQASSSDPSAGQKYRAVSLPASSTRSRARTTTASSGCSRCPPSPGSIRLVREWTISFLSVITT